MPATDQKPNGPKAQRLQAILIETCTVGGQIYLLPSCSRGAGVLM